jgi:hypothetical protein
MYSASGFAGLASASAAVSEGAMLILEIDLSAVGATLM